MSRATREAFNPNGKSCYRVIERGTALGNRKPKHGLGTWVMRCYIRGNT
jgi:hypothetical protein